jgi:mono/diheme cytochrome c family protein
MIRTTRLGRRARVATGLLTAGLVAGLAGAGLAAPDLTAGKALFAKHCFACHTPDGKAKMRGAPDLSSKAVQDKIGEARMIQIVLNGTSRMPGYKKVVTQADATNLIAYVRTLGK